MSDDMDVLMARCLLEMEMLSQGSTTAWDSSSTSTGKPGSKVLALRDAEFHHRTPAEHYQHRYQRAAGPTSKRAVYEDALLELKRWRGWVKRDEPAGETRQQWERRLLKEGQGFDALVVAQTFRTSVTTVRRLRLADGRSVETGNLPPGRAVEAVDDSPERIRELAAQGMSVRAIAMLTRASKSTVDRVIKRAA